MKSRREIELDFVNACTQAQELSTISVSLSKLAGSNMIDTLALISSGWQGDSADDFAKRTDIVRNQLLECADDLEKIAGHIHGTAQAVYKAEMLAIGLCGR